MWRKLSTTILVAGVGLLGCQQKEKKPARKATAVKTAPAPSTVDAAALAAKAKNIFGTPSPSKTSEDDKIETARVDLGRMLYYDKRLSKNHDISCNTCHDLANYGVDIREDNGTRLKTSKGHKGQLGDRNSPTTYNAYFHLAQFWDGRAATVEEQAKGPVTNPVEMAMADQATVVKVLKSIPGYADKFKAAFPKDGNPITYDNMANAIGAFERKLITKAPIDDFLAGKHDALTNVQLEGMEVFMEACITCHMGPGFGGSIYQKLGLIKPWPTEDEGRFQVTKNEADKYFFKVPSLRNITKTGPYMHDGSIADLKTMVSKMSEHQHAAGKLPDDKVNKVVAFLDSLTGAIPEDFIKEPSLPENGPKTPKPDPT